MADETLVQASGGIDIAIVGMAGRFPGADDVEALWRNVREGVESVTAFTDAELLGRGVPQSELDDPAYVKAGVLFGGFEQFDASFFGYTPREAQYLDPQQRVFLECAWHALEDAGYDVSRLHGVVGVYAGAGANLYFMRHVLPHCTLAGGGIADLISLLNGNSADSLCTRVAYKMDLRGPAVTVQTACSTSLTAVHLACQSLLGQECDVALAGGVWLNLMQADGYRHQLGSILSSDGHCRVFDARADGTVLGSGVGVVVLKRLDEAIRDDDTIHAVIRASAANNDGARKPGYTAPGIDGQAAAILAAQSMAQVDADSIGYLEAHGTGTALGDPIEVAALTQAFRATTQRRGYCAIGALKSNIGHLDAAAGVAGLIKAVMAVRDGILPPTLNFDTPNPKIDFEASPFYVNTQARAWPSGDKPRRAGVSAFGMGGTNVHVVLEQAPARAQISTPRLSGQWVLRLSARSESAVQAQAQALARYLDEHRDLAMEDVAYTLRSGRKRHACRAAVVARDVAEAVMRLRSADDAGYAVGRTAGDSVPGVAWLFPGQGSQHSDMGRALYESEPVFKQAVDRCCMRLLNELEVDLREILYPAAATREQAEILLAQTRYTQPALFVTEYAMAQLWLSRGVQPCAMLGHSVGEYVAACLAGVFSLEDALALIALRARLVQSTEPGAMLAAMLPAAQVQSGLRDGVEVAAINAPDVTVVSGRVAAIDELEREWASLGIVSRRLVVSHAFHSALLEPVQADFEVALRKLSLGEPSIPFISNVTGGWITAGQARSPAYWVEQLRMPVRFSDGVQVLLDGQDCVVLEVGPGRTLGGLVRRHPACGEGRVVLATQAPANRPDQQAEAFVGCLARLWVSGIELDDSPAGAGGRRVRLPGYPFERHSYWIDAAGEALSGVAAPMPPAAVKPCGLEDWFHVPVWNRSPLPAAAHDGQGAVLLLSDGSPLAAAMAARFAALGLSVALLERGAAYADLGGQRHAARATSAEDLGLALAAIQAQIGPVSRICHLWNLGAVTHPEQELHSLLALVQALDATPKARAAMWEMTVCVDGLENVSGAEAVMPGKALLRGPCLVLPQEFPGAACRIVDVVVPDNAETAKRLAAQLVDEVLSDGTDSLVAWRGRSRWVRAFRQARMGEPSGYRLRAGGVYVITGGLGGIGLAIARYLAAHWQARLVLIGRRSAGEAEAGLIRPLEALGAQVLTVAADVSDLAALRNALTLAERRFGALHGVIHAAGEFEPRMMVESDPDQTARALSAKVMGTDVLCEALDARALDFLMLCSSLAGTLGGLGRAAYASANAYLDAVAQSRDGSRGYPVFSVAWDGWRGVGMGAGVTLPEGVGIDPDRGAQAFARIVDGEAQPLTLVVTTNLDNRLAGLSASLEEWRDAAPPQRVGYPRPSLQTAYAAPSGELAEGLAAIWGEWLGLTPVGIHDNFFELGGDSLLAIRLCGQIGATYGVAMHPAEFLRTPTIAAMAELIEVRLIEQIEAEAAADDPRSDTPRAT